MSSLILRRNPPKASSAKSHLDSYVSGLEMVTDQEMAIMKDFKELQSLFKGFITNGVSDDSYPGLISGINNYSNEFSEKLSGFDNEGLRKIFSAILPLTKDVETTMADKAGSTKQLYEALSKLCGEKNLGIDHDAHKSLSSATAAFGDLDTCLKNVTGEMGRLEKELKSHSIYLDYYKGMVCRLYSYSIHFGLALGTFTTSHDSCLKIIE